MKNLDFKLLGQWVIIIGVLIGVWIGMDRRVTIVEAGMHQQMKGYQIASDGIMILLRQTEERLTARLERIEDRLNR